MSSFSTGLYGSTISSIVGNVNDAFSGKTSGIDVGTIVSELMQVEEQPEVQMQDQQTTISSQVSALTSMSSQLTTLYNGVNSLTDLTEHSVRTRPPPPMRQRFGQRRQYGHRRHAYGDGQQPGHYLQQLFRLPFV